MNFADKMHNIDRATWCPGFRPPIAKLTTNSARSTRVTQPTSRSRVSPLTGRIGDVPSATAILDRFLHNAEMISLTRRSYRLQNPGLAPDPLEKTATKAPSEEQPKAAPSEGDNASKPANAPTGSKRPNDKTNPNIPQN